MFYFQLLLNQGLAGIDKTAMVPAIIGVAYTILLIGLLIGLYNAAIRGGDVQALGVTAVKYLVIAMILANWTTVFREVNGSFNQVAQFIDNSSGAGDMFLSWMDQLSQQFKSNGVQELLALVKNTDAALITVLMIVLSYLVYAAMIMVFGFFYTLYGCLLYVTGPLVLALLPMAGVGQLAKSYATNLMIWNSWGILYAIFGSLITAIQVNRINDLSSFAGFFTGTIDSFVLGLISVFYALALGLIPFIAKRLISGDVGSSAFALVRAGATAAGVALAGWTGFAAGASAMTSTSAAAGAGTTGSAATSTAATSSSMPPPQPSFASTIRGGINSAVNGAPPREPTAEPTRSPSPGGAAAAMMAQASGFRGGGVTRFIAYQAGRAAGSMLKGPNSSNGHQHES